MNRSLAIAIALPFMLAIWVGTSVVNVPMYDEWIWSPLVIALHNHTLSFADLWAPQGSHRSLIPSAIALFLAQIDGWNIRVEALLGVAFAAATQYALWRLFRRRLDFDQAARPFLYASLLLYALTQCENWLWGFQLSWFLVNVCAVGAIALLDGSGRDNRRVATAIALAAVGSLSLIFGFAIWVAGAALLLVDRSWRHAVVWCGAGMLLVGVFLIGYSAPATEHGWIASAPLPWLDGVQFVLAYLGAPLGVVGGRWLCEALGLLLIVAVKVSYWTSLPARRAAAHPWLALCTFTFVAAVLEAIGRGGNGVDAALAFRYTTPASLGWISLIGMLTAYQPQVRIAVYRGVLASATLLFAISNLAGAFEALQLLGAQHAAYEALRNPAVHDDEELALYVNDPQMLRTQAAQLAAAQLGPYRDPPFSSPATSSPPTTPPPTGSAQ